MKNKSEYCWAQRFDYKNSSFVGGLVRKSPHPVNTVFLLVRNNIVLHFTDDEAAAVIASLSEALWVKSFERLNPKKFKWLTHKQLLAKFVKS